LLAGAEQREFALIVDGRFNISDFVLHPGEVTELLSHNDGRRSEPSVQLHNFIF
jgi:hypothetical protein